MTSVDRVRNPVVPVGACAVVLGLAFAPAVRGEVVRVATAPSTTPDGSSEVVVSAFPATVGSAGVRAAPVGAFPDRLLALEARPEGGPLAYAGTAPVRPPDADDPPRRPVAGLVPVTGGPVTAFSGPTGGPLGRTSGPYAPDPPTPWITWAPDGASVVLHGFARDPREDRWLARPDARRCDVATARCGPILRGDLVDLPGGGAVQVDAGITARRGDERPTSDDTGDGPGTARRLAARAGRRYAVTIRVVGRPGPRPTWSTSGLLGRGAPAYDRAFPSAAGVLVRTSTVVAPAEDAPDEFDSVEAGTGRAVVVRADGSIRSLGSFPADVVGTLPDGRWILDDDPARTGGRAPSAVPLRALDARGRVVPLRSGARPITPVWAAARAGLRDSLARSAVVERAGVDSATGLFVVVLRLDGDGGGRAVAVPLDGSAGPRLLRDAPRANDDAFVVR